MSVAGCAINANCRSPGTLNLEKALSKETVEVFLDLHIMQILDAKAEVIWDLKSNFDKKDLALRKRM